jgi:hypothetical protein
MNNYESSYTNKNAKKRAEQYRATAAANKKKKQREAKQKRMIK